MKLEKQIINKKIIKKYLFLMILTCILSIFEMPKTSIYYESIISVFFGLIYPILSYFIIVVYSFDLISYYNKNYMMFLRFNNKKEYLEKLTDYCFKNLISFFVIFVLFLLLLCNCYYIANFGINNIDFISIFYIVYNIFKSFIIMELIIKIGIILSKTFSKKVAALYLASIQILRFSWFYNDSIVDSFNKVHLFYGYFFRQTYYNTIFLDLFSFFLQIIILILIMELIKFLTIKYKKIYIED